MIIRQLPIPKWVGKQEQEQEGVARVLTAAHKRVPEQGLVQEGGHTQARELQLGLKGVPEQVPELRLELERGPELE